MRFTRGGRHELSDVRTLTAAAGCSRFWAARTDGGAALATEEASGAYVVMTRPARTRAAWATVVGESLTSCE